MFNIFKAVSIFSQLPQSNQVIELLLQDITKRITPQKLFNSEAYQSLIGKRVVVNLSVNEGQLANPTIQIQLEFIAQHIIYSRDLNNPADLTIKTDLITIDKIFNNRSDFTSAIQQHKLVIEGDQQLLSHLFSVFSEYNLDLEFILSKYVGDVAAYQLNQVIINGKLLIDNLNKKNVANIFSSANVLLPASKRVNYLEARIAKLENRIEFLLNKQL